MKTTNDYSIVFLTFFDNDIELIDILVRILVWGTEVRFVVFIPDPLYETLSLCV